MRKIELFVLGITALALAAGTTGCQGGARERGGEEASAPESAPAGERIENPEAGVAITALPPVLELVGVEGERILLKLSAEGAEGEIVVTPGEEEIGGINLVAAVESHKEDLLGRPGGEFKGQNELGTHLGTAFYSRGRYLPSEDATELEEETVIFLVHPWGDRTLQLIYRYPAGDDSGERIQDHLFALLEQLEPLEKEDEADADAA